MNQHEELDTKFEEELTQAMRAVDAPEGFADRVMARAQAGDVPRARVIQMPRRTPVWASSAIAAVLLLGVFGGERMHVRHEREQAELTQQRAVQAQQQFDAGIRITDETLDHARAQLARAGIELRD